MKGAALEVGRLSRVVMECGELLEGQSSGYSRGAIRNHSKERRDERDVPGLRQARVLDMPIDCMSSRGRAKHSSSKSASGLLMQQQQEQGQESADKGCCCGEGSRVGGVQGL